MPDLLVAGGGPIGLATALFAVRDGWDVTVIDRRRGPIDKACGEGLMPGALRALSGLGVDPDGRPIVGITYADTRHRVDSTFRAGPGRGVRRTTLSAALRSAAEQAGVRFVQADASRPVQDATGVVVAGCRGDYLAAADGLHSPIRRSLGLDLPGRTHRYGLRHHVARAPWTDRVEVHWAPDREAYVTPVSDHCVGVAVLSSRRAPLADQLSAFPDLAGQLRGATCGPVLGAGPLRQGSRRRVAGRVLLVGDAAGYVDALTGEGIAVGLAGARVLVDCLTAGRPHDYERAWRRVTARPRTLTAGLLWARGRPALAPLIVPTAARLPWLFGAAVDQLAG